MFQFLPIKLTQAQLEKLIAKNYFLNLSAKEAYKAYVRAYESHSLKHIYDVQNLGQYRCSCYQCCGAATFLVRSQSRLRLRPNWVGSRRLRLQTLKFVILRSENVNY